jgi:hypothetical protein
MSTSRLKLFNSQVSQLPLNSQFFDADIELVEVAEDFILTLIEQVEQRRRRGSLCGGPGEG